MNAITTTACAAAAPMSRVRLVLGLFKLRIAVLIMLTALGGLAASPGGAALSLGQVLVLALAVMGASAAAGAFNQYVEAESDKLMVRTRGRAFASGALQATPRWLGVIGVLLAVSVGAAWFALNAVAALYIFLGAFTYGVVYTLLLKRRSWTNIVFGGLAGSFAVLAGGAAVAPQLGTLVLLLALVLFLWTPSHFWSLAIANHADYAAAGVPMLPVVVGPEPAARVVHVNTIVLVAASLLPLAYGAGWAYGLMALAGGAHFLHKTHALQREPTRRNALRSFFASMLQLSVLLAGVAVDAALR
jgi:protoheme IX farnesyltransferase